MSDNVDSAGDARAAKTQTEETVMWAVKHITA